MRKLTTRAVRAAIFDAKAFKEAYFDDEATADSAIIVALVGVATYVLGLAFGPFSFSIGSLIQLVLAGVVSWLILAMASWFAASRLFGARCSPQMVMALQGLASLPLVLGAFPGELVQAVGLAWYLALLVIATKEATSLETRNAAVSVLIGFAVAALVRMLFQAPFLFLSQLF